MKISGVVLTSLLIAATMFCGCASEKDTIVSAKPSDTGEKIKKIRAEIPPGSSMTLGNSAYFFTELIINDGSTVNFSGYLKDVSITCQKLTINGNCTIDLTPFGVSSPGTPATPGGQGQARASGRDPHTGPAGTPGTDGATGRNGINLTMVVEQLSNTNGCLWIKTDGIAGGRGGDGGAGGKGSSGPRNGFQNPNGGDGGTGGAGGKGGKGGNTGGVSLVIDNIPNSPKQVQGVAPSIRPTDIVGTIIISGAPGAGGPGGSGGGGGAEGEGHKGSGPLTSDSRSGAHGANGPTGAHGSPGDFVSLPPSVR